jgi:hypothetical protein
MRYVLSSRRSILFHAASWDPAFPFDLTRYHSHSQKIHNIHATSPNLISSSNRLAIQSHKMSLSHTNIHNCDRSSFKYSSILLRAYSLELLKGIVDWLDPPWGSNWVWTYSVGNSRDASKKVDRRTISDHSQRKYRSMITSSRFWELSPPSHIAVSFGKGLISIFPSKVEEWVNPGQWITSGMHEQSSYDGLNILLAWRFRLRCYEFVGIM